MGSLGGEVLRGRGKKEKKGKRKKPKRKKNEKKKPQLLIGSQIQGEEHVSPKNCSLKKKNYDKL